MARIVVAPNALELGVLGEEYALVQRDLEEQGHEVELRDRIEEHRSIDPRLALDFTIAVSVYIIGRVSEHALDAIIRPLVERLIANFRVTRPRKALIYGPDGEVLHAVDLPSEEPQDPS